MKKYENHVWALYKLPMATELAALKDGDDNDNDDNEEEEEKENEQGKQGDQEQMQA